MFRYGSALTRLVTILHAKPGDFDGHSIEWCNPSVGVDY